MRKFREGDVGGRLVYAFTGSSPTAPEVIAFLRDALLVPVYEGYGSTEAGMVRARGRPAHAPSRAMQWGDLYSGRLLCMSFKHVSMQQQMGPRACAADRPAPAAVQRTQAPCAAVRLPPARCFHGQIVQAASHAGCVLLCKHGIGSHPAVQPAPPGESREHPWLLRGGADQHGLGDEQRQRAGVEAGRCARAGLLQLRPALPARRAAAQDALHDQGLLQAPQGAAPGRPWRRTGSKASGPRSEDRASASAVAAPGGDVLAVCRGSLASLLRTHVACSGSARAHRAVARARMGRSAQGAAALRRRRRRRRQATAELFDADGYYMTGDVVQQETPNRVVWIDRKKNVLKLSQGEFVSLGRLEAVYKGGSALIHQARGPAARSPASHSVGRPGAGRMRMVRKCGLPLPLLPGPSTCAQGFAVIWSMRMVAGPAAVEPDTPCMRDADLLVRQQPALLHPGSGRAVRGYACARHLWCLCGAVWQLSAPPCSAAPSRPGAVHGAAI